MRNKEDPGTYTIISNNLKLIELFVILISERVYFSRRRHFTTVVNCFELAFTFSG